MSERSRNLIIPGVERYVLNYYVSKLTGKGLYVTYGRAMDIIDNSSYTKPKKEHLKKVVEAAARMNVPKQILKTRDGGKDLSEKLLPGLVDILSAYGGRMEYY